ncbi:MAG: hypothetical protein ABW074_04140 [Sedimenticola sp.]
MKIKTAYITSVIGAGLVALSLTSVAGDMKMKEGMMEKKPMETMAMEKEKMAHKSMDDKMMADKKMMDKPMMDDKGMKGEMKGKMMKEM